MRRTTMLALGVTVLGAAALVALAVPAAGGGVGRALSGLTAEARRRVAAFRTDMAVRESELRSGLLPSEPDVAAARAHRAASAASPDVAAPQAWRTTGATSPAGSASGATSADGVPASPADRSTTAYPAAPPPTTRP
ncbi:hypothetical protein [Georgenia wangjunii]|uniref:hypothetical protein n=1 Tax=Georgenia wangjunii TaxID=3117730 RepID=UPI002F26134C